MTPVIPLTTWRSSAINMEIDSLNAVIEWRDLMRLNIASA